ncbi:PfkB family carbohydrate kinase [Myxococcota bacterium]|nr:PfkB family carbohydrate kinase [Myxococcota bacterium]
MSRSARVSIRPVLGLGLAVIDHVYLVDSDDPAQERARYRERLESGGGMTSTALVQSAALGCPTRILSVVGDDREGRQVARWLREAGVGVRGLVRSADQPTSVAVVIVERGTAERRFLVADRRRYERDVADFDLRDLTPRSILLVDGHFPAQARRAVRRARELGACVIGDFSHPRSDFLKLLPYIDYPIVPEPFAREYAGGDPKDTVRRLHDQFGGVPVVTLGARGGVYLHGDRVRDFSAPRVRTLDTTGAGDVFHGAFAAGLAHGLDLEACIRVAARAGALCCTALGGRGRLMTLREMQGATSRTKVQASKTRWRAV